MGYGPGPEIGYGHVIGGLFGGFLMLAFWVLVIVAIVYLVRYLMNGSGHGNSNQSTGSTTQLPTGAAGHDEAVAIAKRRLATGEITPTEYEEIMRVLNP